jgi:hypothetical protein
MTYPIIPKAIAEINNPDRKNIEIHMMFSSKEWQDKYLQVGEIIGYRVGTDFRVQGEIIKRTDNTITVQLIKPEMRWKGDELVVYKTEEKWNWSQRNRKYQLKGTTNLVIKPEEYLDPSF